MPWGSVQKKNWLTIIVRPAGDIGALLRITRLFIAHEDLRCASINLRCACLRFTKFGTTALTGSSRNCTEKNRVGHELFRHNRCPTNSVGVKPEPLPYLTGELKSGDACSSKIRFPNVLLRHLGRSLVRFRVRKDWVFGEDFSLSVENYWRRKLGHGTAEKMSQVSAGNCRIYL